SVISVYSAGQWSWILLTSFLLFLYVLTFYSGLKHLSVSAATSVLLLGQPITALLSLIFLGKTISFSEAFGLVLIVCGVIIIAGFSFFVQALRLTGFFVGPEKN
ncbi:MAG: EamA family transporter, partial [archaeon]